MKKNLLTLAAMAACVAFVSCNNDEVAEIGSNVALRVNKVGVENVSTRAGITAEAFTNGETLGLYIYRNTGIEDADKTYNDDVNAIKTVNVPYVQGTTWEPTSQAIILSSVKGTVYSYYPYAAANDTQDGTAIPVEVLENQGTGQSDGTKDDVQTDYMWSTPIPNKSNADNKVDLVMNHALAMVSFKFEQTDDATQIYPGEGKVSSIVLKNKAGKKAILTGEATMHIGTGVISNTEPSDNGITITPDASETLMDVTAAEKLPRLLLYPNGELAADDAEVTLTIDGNNYTLAIPAIAGGYVAGKNYLYTIELRGTDLVVNSVAITPWGLIEAGEGLVQQPDDYVDSSI